jgi:alkanesulfonate monooxygenase SsuD/methylene tetrahydromethanopterin reductase-like flavin-dependent oxidoreductase (luciferase family)
MTKDSIMHVGASFIFPNTGNQRSDREVYEHDLHLASLAEPLGFDSVWSVEHHFTDYSMCVDPLLFLSFMAGRTQRIQLGSMVVVLPWRKPVSMAEQVAMLDNLSGGRMILGVGRGTAPSEFNGQGIDIEESRGRFEEAAQIILQGLESGTCEWDGRYYKQSRVDIRPKPFKSFKGRVYAAATSPASIELMARLGIGVLLLPQKPWPLIEQEMAGYRELFRQHHGTEAPPPFIVSWSLVDEDEDRARERAMTYIGRFWNALLDHYEMKKSLLVPRKGYEYYGQVADKINHLGVDAVTKFFVDLQIWGTPQQCYEKTVSIAEKVKAGGLISVFNYAGMSREESEQSMRLFATRVLPELKKLPVTGGQASHGKQS